MGNTNKEYTKKMKERREVLEEFFARKDYIPMKFKDIASLFQVPKAERGDLQLILNDIIKEGKLIENGEGRYAKPDADLVTGIFMSTGKGFAFLRTGEGEEDIFIPASEVSNAFDGDTVTVKLLAKSRGKSREGKVVKIVERAVTTVVGTFERSKNFGFVVPDNTRLNSDIYIPKNGCKDVPKGYKVVAEITNYGDAKHSPEGKIIEILGSENEKGVDI
ncbi:MAG: ribonuclease R, partial [Catonella sp.]